MHYTQLKFDSKVQITEFKSFSSATEEFRLQAFGIFKIGSGGSEVYIGGVQTLSQNLKVKNAYSYKESSNANSLPKMEGFNFD